MKAQEVNFDGLIGPTHNYGGLSQGNIASLSNAQKTASPRTAALQGLEKMYALHQLGLKQGVMLPQQRPHLPTLHALGFTGTDQQIIEKAARQSPQLLANAYSAAAMWTANSCTVSPSVDCADGKVHFTVANLSSMFHRSIEHGCTYSLLQRIFADENRFSIHPALPEHADFGDEGAANHNRLCQTYDTTGIELFVYGRGGLSAKDSRSDNKLTQKNIARQSYEASLAVSRLHQLDPNKVVFAQQNPVAIDAGTFHNDVISVANQNVLFMHETAFVNNQQVQQQLAEKLPDTDIHFIEVPKKQVSITSAIESYLFNSQLITLPDSQDMALLLPEECRHNEQVSHYLQYLQTLDTPIKKIHFFDLRQSMKNGGGPACLRLRVALTEPELAAVNPKFLLTPSLYQDLQDWINKHYRDQLNPQDLADPALIQESFSALEALTTIFELGSFYPFQRHETV